MLFAISHTFATTEYEQTGKKCWEKVSSQVVRMKHTKKFILS